MAICPKCGQESPEGFKFCGNCGEPLGALSSPARETRKTVTVVFCDVTGSTALGEKLDPESLRRVMGRYFDEMRIVVERHEGTVEKFIGDAVMAVFGIPMLHEDDALRAVRAAAEMRSRLEELNAELERDWGVRIRVRTGVNTGEVVAGDPSSGQRFATGDAVNVAKRFEEAAPAGEIFIGEPTYRLVRDAVEVEAVEPLELKGKGDPIGAYRLLGIEADAPGRARRLDSPMVGRAREQVALRQAYERTAGERACHLFTVLGAAGVGKSRLVAEFLAGLGDDATVVEGRCLPYGEGITYRPLHEILRALYGEDFLAEIRRRLAGNDNAKLIVERIGAALGVVEHTGPTDETFWAVRKLFEAEALERPLVVVVDDLQWGAPTLLDLVEHVADWARDAPILLVCLARPELLDGRPGWSGGKLNATSVLLEPLNQSEAGELVQNLLGRAQLAPDIQARVTAAAEGNPLFVEEMLAMLIDDGLLERSNGDWVPVGDLGAVTVPPTIQALLSARLERLDGVERDVIERASVEGKVFHRGAVVELSEGDVRGAVGAHLQSLVRKELVRPEEADFPGEDAFKFRHLLIRDAAYDAMPKELRAELHERYAGWLEAAAGDRVLEYEEILGFHLEQAYGYRVELAPEDEPARGLAEQAASRLGSAGGRAWERGDVSAAANLLGRAASLLPAEDSQRSALLPHFAQALIQVGELEQAKTTISEAIETAQATGDRLLETRMSVIGVGLALQTEPGRGMREVADAVSQMIPTLEEVGDVPGLLEAHLLLGKINTWLGHSTIAEEEFWQVVEYARRVGDHRTELQALSWVALALAYGSVDTATAIARIDDIVAAAGDDRSLPPSVYSARSILCAMRGQFEEALADAAFGRNAYRELGDTLDWASTAANDAIIHMHTGDAEAAVVALEEGLEALQGTGERGFAATLLGHLAGALYALGRYEDAYGATELCKQSGASDDIDAQVHWRRVQAKLVAREGAVTEAVALANETLDILSNTDMIDLRGITLMDLAEIYELSSQPEKRAACITEALDLFERRGNLVNAKRARAALSEA